MDIKENLPPLYVAIGRRYKTIHQLFCLLIIFYIGSEYLLQNNLLVAVVLFGIFTPLLSAHHVYYSVCEPEETGWSIDIAVVFLGASLSWALLRLVLQLAEMAHIVAVILLVCGIGLAMRKLIAE